MNKNDLYKNSNSIYRILSISERILVIDCIKQNMPFYVDNIRGDSISEKELQLETGVILDDVDNIPPNAKKVVYKRYTIIAPIIAVIENKLQRSSMIRYVSNKYNLSKQTIRAYLCRFLSYQNISVVWKMITHLLLYELAKRMGVTGQTLSLWEKGRRKPNYRNLMWLCDFYGLDDKWFGELYDDDILELDDMWMYRHFEGDMAVVAPGWYTATGGPSAYCVLNFGATKEERSGQMVSAGYQNGKGKSIFDAHAKDSFWSNRNDVKKAYNKQAQMKAEAKKRQEKAMQKELMEERLQYQQVLQEYLSSRYFSDQQSVQNGVTISSIPISSATLSYEASFLIE